jgi:toxin-antitoxin system PIN domain toxin
MNTYLLDVNVMVAMAWQGHAHHAAAHAWFADDPRGRRWATCPLTEAAFVRLSCNPAVVGRTVLPGEALRLLAANTALPRHEFWPLELPVTDALAHFRDRLAGHQQITDAYLLALAIENGGVLATFDRAIASLMPADSPLQNHLQLIAC